jgi:glycosyltransferase involved in cell wall biosynthesis
VSEAAGPFFSVVVPTRGEDSKLATLLDALSRQTFPRERFEVIVAFDGVRPGGEAASRLRATGARAVVLPDRRGPGAARNRGAFEARGPFLAFTEDDCTPSPDWLERASARLAADRTIDVLAGSTVSPRWKLTRRPDPVHPHYLPTNLFVRRATFQEVGGYCEDFFDAANALYFREDSDFGFTLEEAGAVVAMEPSAVVTHPIEHPGRLDPLHWARRYEMDALLIARHPQLFRERIEIHRLGPLTLRRLYVRSCFAYVIALAAALTALLIGEPGVAAVLVLPAAIALLVIWGKWGFGPARLPVCLYLPVVLVVWYLRGFLRVRTVAAGAGRA